MCVLQRATCSVQHATSDMQRATLSVQPATRDGPHVTRNAQQTACDTYATGNMQQVACDVHHAAHSGRGRARALVAENEALKTELLCSSAKVCARRAVLHCVLRGATRCATRGATRCAALQRRCNIMKALCCVGGPQPRTTTATATTKMTRQSACIDDCRAFVERSRARMGVL